MIKLFEIIGNTFYKIRLFFFRKQLGYCDKTSVVAIPDTCTCPKKIFLYENTNYYTGAKFILSANGDSGRFIMKKNSGAAQGLTVITGNHRRIPGHIYKEYSGNHEGDNNIDVEVEEDVWIGAGVTLLAGARIGRGSNIGSGAVVRNTVPPYAIVVGNPAKITGFCFTPEEIVEHEKKIYPEEERLSLELLQKNYERYFLKRIKDIKEFTRL